MNPFISVVMPTYNRASIMQDSIRSIIDQTYKNWELIVVDDGSEDGTKRVVESFADPRIVYKKIEHSGVAKARNEGNKMARADIIVVQDSDDLSMPDRLENIIDTFSQNPDADLVYHGIYLTSFDPYHGAIARTVKPILPFSKEMLMRSQYIPGQVSYRRSRILETPYDERMWAMDDYQMLLEFCLKGYKFVPIFKNLYEYIYRDDSVNIASERDGRRKEDVEKLIEVLKEKYDVEVWATLRTNLLGSGRLVKEEVIKK